MHKAEILSDSLLLISLEQPAPRLAQNQKQHTALQKKEGCGHNCWKWCRHNGTSQGTLVLFQLPLG